MLNHDDAWALFDRRRRAWLDQNLAAYLALWTEDMTFQSPLHREPLRGRAAFADLVARSLAAARPVRFDVEHLAVWGDVVMAEWTIAMERRRNGALVEWRGMSVAEMRDGLIATWREYWNPAALAT